MFRKFQKMPKKINLSLKRSTSFIVVLMIVMATISSVWAASRINAPALGTGSHFPIPIVQKGGLYSNCRADSALLTKNSTRKVATETVQGNAANTPIIINPIRDITKKVWNGNAYTDSYIMKDSKEVLKYQIVVTMPMTTIDFHYMVIQDLLPTELTLAAVIENCVKVTTDDIDITRLGSFKITPMYYSITDQSDIEYMVVCWKTENEAMLTGLAGKNLCMTIETKLTDTNFTGIVNNIGRAYQNTEPPIDAYTSVLKIEQSIFDIPIFTDSIINGTVIEHLISPTLATTLEHLNNSNKTENIIMIVTVYSPDDKLVYKGTDIQEIERGQSIQFNVSIDMPENANGSFAKEGYYAKVFLWDSMTLAPVMPFYKFM